MCVRDGDGDGEYAAYTQRAGVHNSCASFPCSLSQTQTAGGGGVRGRETASNTNTKAAKGIQIAIIYHVEIAASHTPPRRSERLDSTHLPRLERLRASLGSPIWVQASGSGWDNMAG